MKKPKYVELDPCMHEILGMPGTSARSHQSNIRPSDTGKTSLLFHAAAQAQQQDILPVIIVTEGKVDWDRAEAMGFDRDQAIVEENLEYLEDVFAFIDQITADVSMGDLPQDVMIFGIL